MNLKGLCKQPVPARFPENVEGPTTAPPHNTEIYEPDGPNPRPRRSEGLCAEPPLIRDETTQHHDE